MYDLVVVCEVAEQPTAEYIVRLAEKAGHTVLLKKRNRYPTADPMTLFLGQLNSQHPSVLVLIGRSIQAQSWILPEIRQLFSYTEVVNIAPVLLDDVPLPERWPKEALSYSLGQLDSTVISAFVTRAR